MMMPNLKLLAGVLVLGGLMLPEAFAQPAAYRPASVLVFPNFDSRPQNATLINVTNTNENRNACPGNDNVMRGDVRLHYVYSGASQEDIDSGAAHWIEFDRFEDLSPGDTRSVLAWNHNPEQDRGYLTIKALSPDGSEAIDFDYLIGSAFVANASIDLMWSYMPYGFEAISANSPGISTCGHRLVSSNAGTIFDGIDYQTFPDILYIDSFLQETPGLFENTLVLMSTSGQDFINEVDFLVWNNKEDRFSRIRKFVCWTSLSLSDVSAVASRLGGDADEFVVETGWVRINGRRVLTRTGRPVAGFEDGPALLGVFMTAVNRQFQSGHALHMEGSQVTRLPN